MQRIKILLFLHILGKKYLRVAPLRVRGVVFDEVFRAGKGRP